MSKSDELFKRAKKVIPGGVNSPVRAFKSIDGIPRFIKSAQGSKMIDVDNIEYIDFIGSWGPMILGHSNQKVLEAIEKAIYDGISFGTVTELEVNMAETITEIVKPVEMVRMVNSGTEAVMSAIRLARGFTKKDKIIKFAGCYHGHADSMLVKGGSGLLTSGNPDSNGITKGTAKDTLIAEYNNLESVENIIKENKNKIAAIIIEPVAANMGVITPEIDFLKSLRQLCDKNDIILIFDEVITGFRLGLSGAQGFFNIDADLVTYGKIIGGGMPVGAYGGRKEIMKKVAPVGDVYQAGTLSGNPIAMTAGLATLTELQNNPHIYDELNKKSNNFFNKIKGLTDYRVNHIGSLGTIFFSKKEISDYESAMKSNTQKYAKFANILFNNGIYIAPSQFEAIFIGNEHKNNDLQKALDIISIALEEID